MWDLPTNQLRLSQVVNCTLFFVSSAFSLHQHPCDCLILQAVLPESHENLDLAPCLWLCDALQSANHTPLRNSRLISLQALSFAQLLSAGLTHQVLLSGCVHILLTCQFVSPSFLHSHSHPLKLPAKPACTLSICPCHYTSQLDFVPLLCPGCLWQFFEM